jgi:hypothetical protein
MITNTGKNILAKYLLGQASAYASYIAIGCGSKPLDSDAVFGDYSNKERLDFEMFRVPITSRGYVTEDGITKIVLTAELPSEERYEISEVGIFSAGSNTAAGAYDSKSIYAFTQDENWEHHNSQGAYSIPVKYTPLDNESNNIISDVMATREGSEVVAKVFQTNADNRIFTDEQRVLRYERCRFLNNTVMIKGNSSALTIDGSGNIVIGNNSEHIHLTGAVLDFNKNAPTDEIKLSFAVINKDGESTEVPNNVKLLLEFSSSDTVTGQFARFQVNINNGTGTGQHDFSTNRYLVATRQLQELYKSTGFTWSQVDVVKIYACVTGSQGPTDNFYIALDALKLENTSSSNPLYGMTGYSVIKNTHAATIVKSANTTNYIEFRFALDVQ